jgi:hypothetical protein
MTIVSLTWQEFYMGSNVASMRMIANMRDGCQHRWGELNGEGHFERELAGCLGELAVAKHCNLYWCGFNRKDTKGKDVGGLVQVRAALRANYRLILHPDDIDDDPFVLALAHDLPNVTLRGWILARDGKRQTYWEDPTGGGRPAFFVPQTCLRPMDERTNWHADQTAAEHALAR